MNELVDDAMRRRFVRRHVGLNASREDNATWVKLEGILDGLRGPMRVTSYAVTCGVDARHGVMLEGIELPQTPRKERVKRGITLCYARFSFAYPPWSRAKTFRLIKSETNMSSS